MTNPENHSPRRIVYVDDIIMTIQGRRYKLVPFIEKKAKDNVIISICCTYFKTSLEKMKKIHPDSLTSYCKQMCIFLLKKHTILSYKHIGTSLGLSHHSSALHARGKMMNLLDVDESARTDLKELELLKHQ